MKHQWNGQQLFKDDEDRLIFFVQRMNSDKQIIADFETGECKTVECQDYMSATIENKVMKVKVEQCYKKLKDTEELLRELRKLCIHSETEFVNYQTRPGQIWPNTEVCSICGEIVKWDKVKWIQ